VPLRNMNFTGREEILESVHACVTSPTDSAVLLYALRGLGGVGKTQIAAEYAHRYQDDYDVVWWIPADQENLISPAIAGLAPYLKLESGSSVKADAAAVLDALRRGDPYPRWLLIFDGADESELMSGALLDGPGHTIVTSRNQTWGDGTMQSVMVDVFSRDESRDFLNRRLPGIGAADSDQLAELLGDLPIALEQAGALQAQTAMSVSEYRTAFETNASRLLQDSTSLKHPVPVTATWAVSITELKATVPAAVSLLRICSFFGPNPIPRNILSEGRGSVRPELAEILGDPVALNRAITGLARYSLAMINRNARTLQVHRVVQALVREDLSPDEQDLYRLDAQLIMAAAAAGDPDDASSWPQYNSLAEHFMPAGIAQSTDATVRHLVRCVVRYHYLVGNYDASVDLGQQALDAWIGDPETLPRDIIALKRHLGNTLRAQGRYPEAFELNSRAIEEATSALGPDHPETLRIINSHGGDLRSLGQFAAAYELDADSVPRHLVVFGERDRRTLRALNNFGLDKELAGDYAGARELHEQVYQAGSTVYGDDNNPAVLVTLNNLARAIRLSGSYAEGLTVSEDTYRSCRNTLGPSHPTTLHAMMDLAIARRQALGGSDEAVAFAREMAGLYQRLRHAQHPRTLTASIALANVLREAGAIAEATLITERAVSQFPAAYGPTHPYTYAVPGNLALLRRRGGDFSEARSLHESAVARLADSVGPGHCWTLACSAGLASDLSALGDLDGALERGEAALGGLSGVLGADHPITLACAMNVAADLSALGRSEAGELREQTGERYISRLGADHPTVLAALAGQRIDSDFDPQA
jgi:tetratricopeptide (TPR) repeat protein